VQRIPNGKPTIEQELFIMKYKIVLHKSDEGYSVSCPGLPGCWSQGATEEEATSNIQEAIKEYMAAVDELMEGGELREVEVSV
jgi:predicted RNase H-like HicB family nuclease